MGYNLIGKHMKNLVILACTLVASTSFASAIQHKNCNIYLPTNAVLESWGESRQDFINKGYTPIETPSNYSKILKDDLVANVSINVNSNPEFLGKSKCTISLAIEKIVNDSAPYVTATLFSKQITQSTLHVMGSVFGYHTHCKKAETVFTKIPKCEIR
jgi:hypothetical protein